MSLLAVTSGDIASGVVSAEGVDFDGTYDYLSRSSDLVGNTDSKTFTFSCWFDFYGVVGSSFRLFTMGSDYFTIMLNSSGYLLLTAKDSSNNTVVYATNATSFIQSVQLNFSHLLISIDLSNASNRRVFLNDVDITSSFSWSTYTNTNIDFTQTAHFVGSTNTGTQKFKGRISNVFLDYTYRDLSIEANRRLFITADGKPALRNSDASSVGNTGVLSENEIDTSVYGVHLDGSTNWLNTTTNPSMGSVKTITFSCWLYYTGISQYVYSENDVAGGDYQFILNASTGGNFYVTANTSVGEQALYAYSNGLVAGMWNHVMISIDLTNSANRHFYINGNANTVTWSTYLDRFIPLFYNKVIGATSTTGSSKMRGKLAHVFVKTSYIDLSIQANRELFLLNNKPALNQASLSPQIYVPLTDSSNVTNIGTLGNVFTVNGTLATASKNIPILYLPMKDAATTHINLGTGGNFTANGTFATSNRGANQDNCVASTFDGSADYLSRTSLTGVADGKQFISSCTFRVDGTKSTYIPYIYGTTTQILYLVVSVADSSSNSKIYFSIKNIAGTQVVRYDSLYKIPINSTNTLTVSCDLSNSANRKVLLNGIDLGGTWSVYSNATVEWSQLTYISLQRDNATSYSNGNIGELYFDTKYIDLATNNPFWDSIANKPKPVRQVIRETGVTPLIAMPLDASNAGKNYGTGGDFTANSAPYVGARGASEFWARSAKFLGSSGYLSRLVPSVAVDSKYISCMFTYNNLTINSNLYLLGLWKTYPSSPCLYVALNASEQVEIFAKNTSNITILNMLSEGNVINPTVNTFTTVLFSINLQTGARSIHTYWSDSGYQTRVWNTPTTLTNDFVRFSEVNNSWVNSDGGAITTSTTGLASLYFTTDYIDFSQEVNRLKFVDGLGYPLDLKKQIEAGVIPKPLIYLPFDDPSNLGKDASGNNNHFTVVGTVTQGADVNG